MSETIERYVETIFELEGKEGRARTRDIADELEIKEPSVTEMLQKLQEKNIVEYEPYHGVSLTQKGEQIALKLERKHTTLSKFLRMLGVNGETAEEDACKIEHIVNPKTLERLEKFLKFVEESPEEPIWLKHYKRFVDTGEHPECEHPECERWEKKEK
ncbi:hypothetical protein AKJ51_02945 [candidate division MSBL1 archaeon SCGC-AAA382A20]|uniref:HTH dtxR-type domain-containing protein n=1 Tax=candidate division MSBL1 archaeon SCGC-AAA382A20 TaxID=1698280 RepID=A0A133VK14_9EURY|nr:hypothetical protein AKJ51_02945 [candidate division MSBL1 archaeon SCGC-AAA382A20]